MLINIILLVLGFIVLIKGADLFVDGACGLAQKFKVSKMLIGLTIVSFGTSAPELAVSIKSLLVGKGDFVLGNVIGSNILNILLIIGFSALIHSLQVKNSTVKKELPITILITSLFAVLLSDNVFDRGIKNTFTRADGIIVLLFFSIFIYYLISMSRKKITEEQSINIMPLTKAIIYIFLGLIGVIIGSHFVVESSTIIAKILGVSDRLISLTIIALGTSLPELVTSLIATKKGEYDIAIGNVVGSNIFNIGVVIGVPVSIIGGIGTINFNYVDLLVMVISAIFLFMFSFNDYKISKREGFLFLLLFIIYYIYILKS